MCLHPDLSGIVACKISAAQQDVDGRVANARELEAKIDHHRRVAQTLRDHKDGRIPEDPESHLGYN